MEEYPDIRLIEDLYNEEEICGKSYLFCVDNDIDTLQDLQKFIAEASSYEKIPDDLLSCSIKNTTEESGQNEASKNIDDVTTNEDIRQKCERLYTDVSKDCSVRAYHSLTKIQKECYDSGLDFYQFLLDPDLSKRLQFVRNIGSKTYAEIEIVANKIRLGLDDVLRRYDDLYITATEECSVRSKNCLFTLQQDLKYPSKDFFNLLLSTDLEKRLLAIKNTGRKTIAEILQAVKYIKDELGDSVLSTTPIIKTHTQLEHKQEELLSDIWLVIAPMKTKYSVRCQNAIDRIISDNNNSIVQLYNYVRSADYTHIKIKNIGKKTRIELDSFCQDYISIVDMYIAKEHMVTNAIRERSKTEKYESIIGLTTENIKSIVDIEEKIGRVPFFSIVDSLIISNKRDWNIIFNTTNIYNANAQSLEVISNQLGLTRERVRQLRLKIYSDIKTRIQDLMGKFDASAYKIYCNIGSDFSEINRYEDTEFSTGFIKVVLSLMFGNDYSLLGDDQRSLLSLNGEKETLHIIPLQLRSEFNFQLLLNEINYLLHCKLYEDYHIELKHYMLNYFKKNIRFDIAEQILEYIKEMLYDGFNLIANDNVIVLKKNANKSIPECVEEILEANGDVMSLDEIYDIFESKYPGLTKSKTALRGSIIRSDKVDAISRSGKYALKEWSSKGIKTGTIKDIVYDYLLGFSTPQSIADIEAYVVQYRPDTDAYSIYNNLSLDNKGLFTLLMLNEMRYVAISTHNYGDEFVNVKEYNSCSAKRSYQESFDVLYQFVQEYNRFPFLTSKDDNEVRISRFLNIARVGRKKNTLSEKELFILNEFERECGDKEISKDQYNWDIRYSDLENYILVYGKLPTVRSDASLYTWVNKQKTSISRGKLREEDATKINNLLTQVL